MVDDAAEQREMAAGVKKAQKLGAGAYVRKPYVLEKIGLAIRYELNR